MSLTWEATVKVGPYTYVVQDDDGFDQYGVADGLVIQDTVPDDALLPYPARSMCTFAVVAAAADDVAGIVQGAGVAVEWGHPRASPDHGISFLGRVTDVTISAHQLGVVVEVTAVDAATADFSELLVGYTNWPQEAASARLARIMGAQPVPWAQQPIFFIAGVPQFSPSDPLVLARTADPIPFLQAIAEVLDVWALDFTTILTTHNDLPPGTPAGTPEALGRYMLVPDGYDDTPTGPAVDFWSARVVMAATSGNLLPGVFAQTPDVGGWGVLIPPDGADKATDTTVNSAYIDLSGVAFSQRKGGYANTLTVKYGAADDTVQLANGDSPAVSVTIPTALVNGADATTLGNLYLPVAGGGQEWAADRFSWRLYADPEADTFTQVPVIGQLLAVAPVQERHSPLSRPWYVGVLVGRTFTLNRGDPVVTMQVRPQQRRLWSNPLVNLEWDELPAGVTWADLNTRDTWTDYSLLREA